MSRKIDVIAPLKLGGNLLSLLLHRKNQRTLKIQTREKTPLDVLVRDFSQSVLFPSKDLLKL